MILIYKSYYMTLFLPKGKRLLWVIVSLLPTKSLHFLT